MADTRAQQDGNTRHPNSIRSAHEAKPRSLRFLPDGLQNDGPSTLLAEIAYQLGADTNVSTALENGSWLKAFAFGRTPALSVQFSRW